MEKLQLATEKILFRLRSALSNKKSFSDIFLLLEQLEEHGFEKENQRILEEIIRIFSGISINTSPEDNDLVVGCVIWLTHLQERKKLPLLNETQFNTLFQWLIEQNLCCDADNFCTNLIAIEWLFASHPENRNKYFVTVVKYILKYITRQISIDLLINLIQSLQNIIYTTRNVKLSDEQIEVCNAAGNSILTIFYEEWKIDVENIYVLNLVLESLQILNEVIILNSSFAKIKVAELLGLATSYMHFGVDAKNGFFTKPQKLSVSQQALHDSAEEIEVVINSENARNSGGKTPKARRPRTVVKETRINGYGNDINRNQSSKERGLLFDIKVSDSDVSDSENTTNRILFERSRKAKIRLAAINLVGNIARLLERKIIFGYWHALFPNGTAESNSNLLYVGQNDPNLRCRSAALQVCAQILYGSKGFLHQAEMSTKRCPSTYIPFSISLGYTVRGIYKSLSTILSSESSLPVLTHALKCLAVLVQASPFQQFEKGFVQNFVKDVKPLVYHRDPSIQVSALMVMEFLVALFETSSDIADAVGLPTEIAPKQRLKSAHLDKEINIYGTEEFIDSEDENVTIDGIEKITKINSCSTGQTLNTSWLLLRVLNNLSDQDNKIMATSVRIESLQVLIVMSSHFAMVKSHLRKVAEILIYSLNDSSSDIRLYAARCVDAFAYQINRYLIENSSMYSSLEIQECEQFWLNMMAIVVSHIRRDFEEISTVRIVLCDSLSNIGVLMFENMPHTSQISLLSFLSGVSSDSTEDILVRAAAVRALAVFALYPSLLGDLVFIENTAELTLDLIKSSNLIVRIKSFWSLGNISDALIEKETKISQTKSENISDDLLYRLISATTIACNDSDKVRCNAVRTLGNLLRLITDTHFHENNKNLNWLKIFELAICKLTDCIRSSGNAKVKWNTCYAISNLMRNRAIFQITDLNWQETLYSALNYVIVHHSNFKVRINAANAITNITDRSHFGVHYERFWISVLEAIEQSHNLENFHEYNHRDNLQDQLCLALSHIVGLATDDDLLILKKYLLLHVEIIHNTWKRVLNRMVPEKANPLLSCTVILLERRRHKEALSLEHKNAIEFLIKTLTVE